MIPYRQIRAEFDRDSIVIYQAYRKQIAEPAIKAGRFVEPGRKEKEPTGRANTFSHSPLRTINVDG